MTYIKTWTASSGVEISCVISAEYLSLRDPIKSLIQALVLILALLAFLVLLLSGLRDIILLTFIDF